MHWWRSVVEVSHVSKRSAELTVIQRTDANRELKKELHLYVGLPKGDRQRSLIDALVQLGVTHFTPLITSRGVAQPVETALNRLRRQVIEASKQCGRNRLMEIQEPVRVDELLRLEDPTEMRLVTHPYGDSFSIAQVLSDLQRGTVIKVLVGPEGGFTEAEVASLVAGSWRSINLGKRILRVEVAATSIASMVAGFKRMTQCATSLRRRNNHGNRVGGATRYHTGQSRRRSDAVHWVNRVGGATRHTGSTYHESTNHE